MGTDPSKTGAANGETTPAGAMGWLNFLFGGVGLFLIPWTWDRASSADAAWVWGLVAAGTSLVLAVFLLKDRGGWSRRERRTALLGVAFALAGAFIGLARASGSDGNDGIDTPSAPTALTETLTSPSLPPTASGGGAAPTATDAGWTELSSDDVVLEDDFYCSAFYGWSGPKEIEVDWVDMENGYDVGGSCSGGLEVRVSFGLGASYGGFRVTAGILKLSDDPGPIPIRVLPNEDDSLEICEGTVRVGHPMELTLDASGLSRVTVVVELPERLTDAERVVGIGNAEVSNDPPSDASQSCGPLFEGE